VDVREPVFLLELLDLHALLLVLPGVGVFIQFSVFLFVAFSLHGCRV